MGSCLRNPLLHEDTVSQIDNLRLPQLFTSEIIAWFLPSAQSPKNNRRETQEKVACSAIRESRQGALIIPFVFCNGCNA